MSYWVTGSFTTKIHPLKESVSITAISSISPLGISLDETWASYQNSNHCFKKRNFNGAEEWIAPLPEAAKNEIDQLRKTDSIYKNLDDSVLYALYASRKAVRQAGWAKNGPPTAPPQLSDDQPYSPDALTGPDIGLSQSDHNFGVNIGSSRGATALFEKYHQEFLEKKRAATLSSPTTTLGNISSWVAHYLQTQGPEISHSITCSTALHSLLNGVAWIKSGMADKFLVGGSEAPLTPFTIAQMKALKIYANNETLSDVVLNEARSADKATETVKSQAKLGKLGVLKTPTDSKFPCQALNPEKSRNSMILGEGASVACLEGGIPENALAVIKGVGYATEPLRHNTSISTDAVCFQKSMRMAVGNADPQEVDAVVMHAPGTIKGDLAEYRAIEKVFCNKLPLLTTNKWKIGHSFGASGMLSIEMAILMLRHQQFIKVPFVKYATEPQRIEKILVNAVGFGGNAVSVLLRSVN